MMASGAERERRYGALRRMMAENGYSALILGGNAEAMQRGYVRYVADWRLWGGKGFVVFPLAGDPVLVLGAGSQSYWSQVVGWIPDVRAAGDMVAEVAAVVKALGLATSTLGVVGMSHVFTYGDMTALTRALGEAALADATNAVDDIMAVKSDEELALAAETYRAVAAAHGTLHGALAPGKTERAAMAQAVATLAEWGCLDGIAHLTNGTRPFFRPPTDRIIAEDDIIKVSLEFAGPGGYWIELAGVYSFRPAPPRELRLHATCVVAVERVKEVLRPGATGGDVTRAIEETFAADGWNVTGRALWDGHLIGLNVIRPPYGVRGNADVFQTGMIFNVHPGLVVDDDQMGIIIQDNLVVTPDGGVTLDVFPQQWQVLPH
jgi:Xaa-Pro aminopeptidase